MLHVGALRTVLFDHLLAKKHGGQNILRIEDTDRNRYDAASEQEFIETLKWVGIEFDEGPHVGGPHAPYRQSERKEAGIYDPHIQRLLDSGKAYWAFDTPEELQAMRAEQEASKQNTGYFGGIWRDASPDQVEQARAEGRPGVVRLRVPRDTTIVLNDLVRGQIEWDSNRVDDQVLLKADGMPTYHFAAMVDDHLMGITHILRGDEWLPSAPKHVVLFQALGWEPPIFVHCPVILGKDGKKLSKRHGATRVLDYAAEGYLPEALKNFIALIGWSPGEDREVMSEAELIEAFDLSRVQPSPGHFDLEKLQWLNGHSIRAMSSEQAWRTFKEFAAFGYAREYHHAEVGAEDGGALTQAARIARWKKVEAMAGCADEAYALACVQLAQERVTTLADFGEACDFFFTDEPAMDEKAVAKWFGEAHVPTLFASLKSYDGPFDAAGFEAHLRGFMDAQGLEKFGPVVHPTRVALTGRTNGPGLFELMEVLGPDRIRARIGRAMGMIS